MNTNIPSKEQIDYIIKIVEPFINLIYRLHSKNKSDGWTNLSPKNKAYYDYVPSRQLESLFYVIAELQKKGKTTVNSFCELGCGYPIISYIVQRLYPRVKLEGYEIDNDIANYANFFPNSGVKRKDILKLTPKEIQESDLLFYYVPIHDNKLMNNFVKKLIKNTRKGQIILININADSVSYSNFKSSTLFEQLSYQGNFIAYERIK